MQLHKGDVIELTVEKLAFGGAGLGTCRIPEALAAERPSTRAAEGLVTFVPNVIPGDRIRAALTKIKTGHLEAQLETLMEPSPLRTAPRCAHFDVCGGCTWQNLKYEDQLRFKQKIVHETLEHLGGFSAEALETILRPILPCADPWNYRNKVELSFDQKMESGRDGANVPVTPLQLGFHLPKRRYDIFDLNECHLPSPLVAEIVALIRDFARQEGLTVFHPKRGIGLLQNVIVREGKATGQLMIQLVTSMEPFPQVERFKTRFDDVPWRDRLASLIWTQVDRKRGQRTRRHAHVLSGQDFIEEALTLPSGESLNFQIGPEAFFQPNTHQAQVLYGQVLDLAGLTGQEVVYDLYCGTGTIGLFCAQRAGQVYGIEVVPQAIENARANARRNGIDNIDFWVGDVGKLVHSGGVQSESTPPPPDVVVVDPPRAGLSGSVPDEIAALNAPRLIYVSCNPATLSRDLKRFTELGYRLEVAQPVDMFPHTYHIETVTSLRLDS